MENYLSVIKKSPLFRGINEEELLIMLKKLGAHKKTYRKGNFIFYAGDQVKSIGIVLSGAAHVVQEDFWGNRNILAQIPPGGMFGEAFACVPQTKSEVDVVIAMAADILFIDTEIILEQGMTANPYSAKLFKNLLAIVAQKNIFLTQKMRHISQRTTRQKLLSFLSSEALRHGKSSFDIAFNRQQLADFLSVDRSAMSSELSRMKDEGLIDYAKNHFELKDA